jgi:hypothetical protein
MALMQVAIDRSHHVTRRLWQSILLRLEEKANMIELPIAMFKEFGQE